MQNRPQHHLGGTASPRFREASQAAQGHLSCCRLRTRSLLSHTPAPRLCSASAPHHRAAPVPRSLRKTHPEKRSHTPAALRAVSWSLEVHLSAASPKRPGIWRQRMPRSPPEKEAALGRCPWDGAAGEAHTGTAGSRLDAEHGLDTPASCTRATPNPEPTAGLRGARVTRSSPAPCTDSRQGLSHVQPPAGGISAAPAAPGSRARGLCTGDTRQKLQGSMMMCSVGIFLLAVLQTHIQCLLNVTLTGCCSACCSPGNLVLPAS